ncbi:MAG: sensor histidine kinase KdpD [Holophaga sp.]|nr:sensor histidine kinase KdpD [Holophaga sp.]
MNRARLKIFFGMAPGVGKTYAMLQEACIRKTEGVDVLSGVVETHGRQDTMALTQGIEVLPKKRLPYRGVQLEEFDLEAALKRRPQLILMDELAHTNVQGSLHVKRWQDVIDLLDAGIDVFTTVNVQHLESLKDTVAQITGVLVRENIPDTLLKRADQIELVDIPPEELLERLKEGKVYVPEQAQHAVERFFRKGNLLALRELALRRTADHVDADMRRYMVSKGIVGKTWAAGERLLVCINSKPGSASLIRATQRLSESLSAPWIAAYVETGKHIRYSDEERERLEDNLRLAERLGGETSVVQGDLSTAEDIIEFATSHNVTKIIIGKPAHPRWIELVTGSMLEDLVRRSGDIDIHVIASRDERDQPNHPAARRKPRMPALAHFLWGAVTVALITGICLLLNRHFEMADVVMIYMLGILLVASRFGRWPSLASSVLSVLAVDFFFTPPRFSFAVGNIRHLATYAVMLLVGLVIGNLTERIRSQARLARNRESRIRALFRLSGELTRSSGSAAMAESAIRNVATHFQSRVAIFLPGTGGRLAVSQGKDQHPVAQDELGVAQWVYDHHEPAGITTDTLPGAKALYLPLQGAHELIGVMGIQPMMEHPGRMEPDQRHLLEAFANQTAVALERAILAERNRESQRQVDREQLRNALLSSVSHDLRTPLGGITGAASTLLEERDDLPEASRRELLETIYEESNRLQRLVTNLLDVTRLESGVVDLAKEWVPLEEVVGSALEHMSAQLGKREVKVELPANLPLVQADPVLLGQVVINLVENACKFSPADQPIEIKGWATERSITLSVTDHGPGIPEGQEEHIFEKLVRFQQGEARPGAGLGLAICRGVVQAHGGKIMASNRASGGAQFMVSLPLGLTPPPPPSEE